MNDHLHITSYDRVAYHEAGHAIVGAVLRCPPDSISLQPHDDGTCGRVGLRWSTPYNADDLRRQIAVHVGGVCAERIATGEPYQPFGGDSSSAWACAQKIHGIEGDPDKLQNEIDIGIERAEAILRQHWQLVQRLAKASRAWFNVVDQFQRETLQAMVDEDDRQLKIAACTSSPLEHLSMEADPPIKLAPGPAAQRMTPAQRRAMTTPGEILPAGKQSRFGTGVQARFDEQQRVAAAKEANNGKSI